MGASATYLRVVFQDIALHILEQVVQLLAVYPRGFDDDGMGNMLDDEIPYLDGILPLQTAISLQDLLESTEKTAALQTRAGQHSKCHFKEERCMKR